MTTRSPNDFLRSLVGKRVVVKLNTGVDYRGMYTMCMLLIVGVLACLDGYLNIAMEQTEEYIDGQLRGKFGDTFIRGNNGSASVVP